MARMGTGMALATIMLVGAIIFLNTLQKQEEKRLLRDTRHKGNYLINLLALHSIRDFEGDKKDYLIKTLMGYSYYHGLIFCWVYDRAGQRVVSMTTHDTDIVLPQGIANTSPATVTMGDQLVQLPGARTRYYEFAKPLFENGAETGRVRIGLKIPAIKLFSAERIRLFGIFSFFILSAAIIVTYGFSLSIRHLSEIKGKIMPDPERPDSGLPASPPKELGFKYFVDDMSTSLLEFKERIEKIEKHNENLASRLSVTRFEENKIKNILNSVTFGIILTDLQDNVFFINEYVVNLFNLNRADVVDHPITDAFSRELFIPLIERFEILDNSSSVPPLDMEFPELAPGEVFRISCMGLKDNHGAPIGRIVLLSNVTREKKAEKSMHEFTAHLAHELRTPLTTIQSYSELLMDGEVNEIETQKEFYNTINTETTRLGRLVKDVLNFTKIEMGSLTLAKELVKTEWLFEDCILAVEGSARKKNITIKKKIPDHFPTLMGDKEQLKGALINILGNAVKYTPENGLVEFGITRQDETVVFDIKDNGYGIDKEDLSRIFDKFYRSRRAEIAEQQGSGLGLAITSEIVRLHDGDIQVQSGPGQGTQFKLVLPKNEYYLEKR